MSEADLIPDLTQREFDAFLWLARHLGRLGQSDGRVVSVDYDVLFEALQADEKRHWRGMRGLRDKGIYTTKARDGVLYLLMPLSFVEGRA